MIGTLFGYVSLLHDISIESAYHDPGDTAYSQRRLMRIWLNNPEMTEALPASLKIAWERVFDDSSREKK
jgi:hypothetical protein